MKVMQHMGLVQNGLGRFGGVFQLLDFLFW